MAIYYGNNSVSLSGIDKVYVGTDLVYQSGSPTPTPEYFYVEAIESGSFSFNFSVYLTTTPTIQYSFDKQTWNDYTEAISLSAGNKCYFKGNNESLGASGYGSYIFATAKYKAGGNIMSLLDETMQLTTVPSSCFATFFGGGTSTSANPENLIDVEPTLLPATTLASQCYQDMFGGCTNLISMPNLPATELASACYRKMFRDCVGIATIPALQITSAGDTSLFNFAPKIRLTPSLTTLTSTTFGLGTTTGFGSTTMNIYYEFTDSDTPTQSVLDNCVSVGGSKSTFTYNVYTDNTAIKNAALAKAGQYTIVSVYHLDGSAWE